MMGVKLKVLTLNCWGVPIPWFGSKLRAERMAAIANQLAKAEFDVIFLQEIWSQRDYETLCAKVLTVVPYTHYFHSGVLGSGLCIFSKHPILETQGFAFTLNGYAHKIFHGDWYGRKAVGLAKILVQDIRINVYNTHLHAGYEAKTYSGHMVAQALELSQIIKNTGDSADVVLVAGDFNYTPDGVGYKLVTRNGNVRDAWLTQQRKVTDQKEGQTCERHDNSFTSVKKRQSQDSFARIDYLMYRNNTGYSIDCETCYVTMRRVPGQDYNYSDHEGVAAEFLIRKNVTAMAPLRESGKVETCLVEAKDIIESGIHKAKSNRVFFIISAFICLIAIVFSADGAIFGVTVNTFQSVLMLAIAVFLWNTFIMSNIELAGLKAATKDINNLIKSNPM